MRIQVLPIIRNATHDLTLVRLSDLLLTHLLHLKLHQPFYYSFFVKASPLSSLVHFLFPWDASHPTPPRPSSCGSPPTFVSMILCSDVTASEKSSLTTREVFLLPGHPPPTDSAFLFFKSCCHCAHGNMFSLYCLDSPLKHKPFEVSDFV